jgi:glycosidase
LSSIRRRLGVWAVLALLIASCTATESADRPATTGPVTTHSTVADAGDGPAAAPVRHPMSNEVIYFVMPDRFANGDPANDTAGLDGGPLDHGFLPADKAYHHGGDLVGLTDRLDYIQGLGATAVWITPPFTNRYVQGDGTVDGSSSSYHGYWQLDWDQVDPHLGTEQEMQDFIAAAHQRGMKVIFDVVINHTADVIDYADGSYGYKSLSGSPYVDAEGNEVDPEALARGEIATPVFDPSLFPHVPVVVPEWAEAKSPAWLNDVTLYHNRGNSTFSGESSLYGDFFGLDDLFTEHPKVVEGMIELHIDLIERYDIDGFRIDTMKHVNPEFWAAFAPAVQRATADLGKPDFFFFGEVAGEDPILQSSFTNLGVTSTLDFLVSGGLERYVAGGGNGSLMADVLDEDDWFTDADNNASMQVTFFGNHDMGRMGNLIDRGSPSASDDVLLARMKMGFNLLFLLRGVPVIYYGDEQGFVGAGGDQLARQDMFPSVTPEYQGANIGGGSPADDNFDPNHPLYRHVSALAALRAEHPAFAAGATVVHDTDGPIFAFSRIDRNRPDEYVVVTNANGSLTVPARFRVASAGTEFVGLPLNGEPAVGSVTSDAEGELFLEVPPLTTAVLKAASGAIQPIGAPTVNIVRPDPGVEIPTPRYRIEADVESTTGNPARPVEVTFAVSVDGDPPTVIGVDDAPPYRVYWSNGHIGDGTSVELFVTAVDGDERNKVTDSVMVTMGER